MTSSELSKRLHLGRAVAVVSAGLLLAAMDPAAAQGASMYWDTNGTTAGSGNAGGLWSGTNWTGSSTGVTATVAWTAGNDAIFSAGTDGTGTFTVDAGNSTISVKNMAVNYGNLTIGATGTNTPTLQTLPAAGQYAYTVATGTSLTIGSGVSLDTNGANTLLFSTTGTTTVNGNIINSVAATAGSVRMNGSGLLILGGNNSYTGNTTMSISGGTLRLTSASALPTNSLLAFNAPTNGSVLELTAAYGDFTRPVGTTVGTGVVYWTQPGGFGAIGGNRVVNLGGAGATVSWNAGGFVPNNTAFILSSAASDSTVDFQNPINFNGGSRTVNVNDGSAVIDAKLSGILTGNTYSDLFKGGNGTLALYGNNTYGRATQVNAGRLLINGTTSSQGNYQFGTLTANATLGGTGTIGLASTKTLTAAGASSTAMAIVAPGDPTVNSGVGTLTINVSGTGGIVTFGANSQLSIDISDDNADLLKVNGPMDVSNALAGVSIVATGTQSQSRYVFATYTGALTGTFTNTSFSGLGSGASLDYSVPGQIAVMIPEPATASLLGLGGIALLASRRRRA